MGSHRGSRPQRSGCTITCWRSHSPTARAIAWSSARQGRAIRGDEERDPLLPGPPQKNPVFFFFFFRASRRLGTVKAKPSGGPWRAGLTRLSLRLSRLQPDEEGRNNDQDLRDGSLDDVSEAIVLNPFPRGLRDTTEIDTVLPARRTCTPYPPPPPPPTHTNHSTPTPQNPPPTKPSHPPPTPHPPPPHQPTPTSPTPPPPPPPT